MEKTKYSNLLIDGYNLIHAIPSISCFVGSDLARARELLLLKLSAYAIKNQVKITVIFDGKPGENAPPSHQPGLNVIFTHGEKADQKIKDMARKITDKKNWQVITSDFDIRFQVDGFGIKSRPAQEFASELESCTRPKENRKRKGPNQAEEKKTSREDRDWAYEVFLRNKKG